MAFVEFFDAFGFDVEAHDGAFFSKLYREGQTYVAEAYYGDFFYIHVIWDSRDSKFKIRDSRFKIREIQDSRDSRDSRDSKIQGIQRFKGFKRFEDSRDSKFKIREIQNSRFKIQDWIGYNKFKLMVLIQDREI